MALTPKLEMRQGQQLVMTPQLQQAIKLLQLSNLELNQFVDNELERNPLLEREEPGAAHDVGLEPSPISDANGGDGDQEPAESWSDIGQQTADATAAFDTEFENVYPDASAAEIGSELGQSGWAGVRGKSAGFSTDDPNLEAFVASDISLKDYLSQQLPLAIATPQDRLIGQYLIDHVDESGYLNVDFGELCEKLGAPEEMVESVLKVLRNFDPPGVFARSLSECLALQLKEQNRYDPQIAAVLERLELLASHDLQRLKKHVGVDMDELSDMIAEIRNLNPKPGLKFGTINVQPVVPDVMVRASADGGFIVELNSETLPRVLVNRTYYSRVTKTAQSTKDKGYLADCLQTANWLVKSLDQRARTILRVAEEIVRQQDGFFSYGVQHLRPLNLKTIATAISMHESTVSRVTSNKYIATGRGIFEMRYFFSSAISSSDDGEAHSSESVRHRIRQLIDNEAPGAILSDDRIVDMLKTDGIDIARRTVAKYREALGIPSSVQRRREKRLANQTRQASAAGVN